MITYSVLCDYTPIQFGLTGVDEVKQNIRTIVTTVLGTCPFYRDFGIDPTIIDMPTLAASALLEVSVVGAIEEYEPRAMISSIDITIEEEKLIPMIKFTLKEEG